jgi:hypothetical protein
MALEPIRGPVVQISDDRDSLLFFWDGHIDDLAQGEGWIMCCYYNRSQPRIVEGNGRCGGAVQLMQRHAVAPDGGAALHDDEGAAGDFGNRWEGLGWGDGGGDGDGVDDMGSHFHRGLFDKF